MTEDEVLKLKVGDKVKTNWYEDEKDIVRTVLYVGDSEFDESVTVLDLDGGEPCVCCGRKGRFIENMNSSWIKELVNDD